MGEIEDLVRNMGEGKKRRKKNEAKNLKKKIRWERQGKVFKRSLGVLRGERRIREKFEEKEAFQKEIEKKKKAKRNRNWKSCGGLKVGPTSRYCAPKEQRFWWLDTRRQTNLTREYIWKNNHSEGQEEKRSRNIPCQLEGLTCGRKQ